MAEGPRKFGRYFLLDMVAQGGMAEIYRARLASLDGAGRLLVIKRIQPSYGSNHEFLQMFKSEIKVTMGFNHPNIVQLYDFGEENRQPFIAMEFVDGRNLRQFMSRFLDLKQRFPVDLATYIIEQAACGLHYAHSFKDKITGDPLSIVHRDISPQNLLISYDGSIKVIDFGIAKATTNSEATRAGVIKGKPSYLSPEQINGDVLDGRSDIFSLGTVLWELLAGKKLFQGDNDLAVLKLIESCQSHVKPPSTINPDVPTELDYIVLKALAKHRDKRYQTAEEFQRALHKFLYGYTPDFNPSDLSYYAKDLFKREIVEDRKKIQRLNDEVERLLSVVVTPSAVAVSREALPKEDDGTTQVSGQSKVPKFAEFEAALPSGTPVEIEKKFTSEGLSPRYRSPSQSGGVRRGTASMRIPAGANRSTRQDYSAIRQARAPGSLKGPAAAVVALAAAAGLFGRDFGIEIPIVSDLAESALESFVGRSQLILEGQAVNVKVTVNDKVVATELPATIRGLPAGQTLRIAVTGQAGTFETHVLLKRGERQEVRVELSRRDLAAMPITPPSTTPVFPVTPMVGIRPTELVPAGPKSILFHVLVTPGGGNMTISVNGKRLSVERPVIRVPLDTDLELNVERPGYRRIQRPFVLDARAMQGLADTYMKVEMEPLHFGFLTLRSTPSAYATILIDGKPWVEKTPLENVKLPVGTYVIKLKNAVLDFEKTLSVQIQEGQVATRDVSLADGAKD